MRKAFLKAGIEICGLISEPTAAVYRHYEKLKKWQKIVVFDWGGGTLDIAVVELISGNIRETQTYGIPLGGDKIDEKIAQWIFKKLLREKNFDISFEEISPKTRDIFLVESEDAKRSMSEDVETEMSFNCKEFGGIIQSKMSRKEFFNLIDPEINTAINAIRESIKNARLSVEEIGCILMVGGSSKLAGLYDTIEREFPCHVIPPDTESDWATAHGAALLNKNEGRYILSQNVGLRLSDDTYFPLLRQGEQIDNEIRTVSFGLVEDCDNARFIFEEKKDSLSEFGEHGRETLGYMTVPTYGFMKEPIRFEYGMDENLMFNARVQSDNRKAPIYWEYGKLRFSYRFPDD